MTLDYLESGLTLLDQEIHKVNIKITKTPPSHVNTLNEFLLVLLDARDATEKVINNYLVKQCP